MRGPTHTNGLSLTVFGGLLIAFNWPLLSIPKGFGLLLWVFLAWGAGIALLWLSAAVSRRQERNREGDEGGNRDA